MSAFVGNKFNQIYSGRFQIQFQASGAGSISVEGRLGTARRRLIEARRPHADWEFEVVTEFVNALEL